VWQNVYDALKTAQTWAGEGAAELEKSEATRNKKVTEKAKWILGDDLASLPATISKCPLFLLSLARFGSVELETDFEQRDSRLLEA
jgi:hypothetical protein